MADRPPSRTIAVIGSGPAGLMAAEQASRKPGTKVTVYEAMPSPGRKLLMAGRSGLNLTHSEPLDAFIARYGDRAAPIRPFIESFSPSDARIWCEELGQPTFVGTSGRVFPEAMKASGLLRAWLRRLEAQGVRLHTRHRWTGWNADGQLTFDTPSGVATVVSDATILALGGASWPRLGSDGSWVGILEQRGITVAPLGPANAGIAVAWSDVFRTRHEGQPLKGIAVHHGANSSRGEAVVTAYGLEGGAIYAISPSVREASEAAPSSSITIDLKPNATVAALTASLARPRGRQSLATYLRKTARLSPVAIGLLNEAARATARSLRDIEPNELAQLIKAIPLAVAGTAPIARAISTAGGISFDEVDANLMLRRMPGVFVAGEMLDWEAPTGGYLLQACLATGVAAGQAAATY